MFKKIVLAAAITLIASSAFAVEANPFYIGATVGNTKVDGLSDGTGFGAFGGYQFDEHFSAELGYSRLGSWEDTGATLKIDQLAISAVGTMPLGNNFSVFGRLGYNKLTAKVSLGSSSGTGSESGVLYGIGAGYTFAPNITGRLELQKAASDTTLTTLSVIYKF